MDWKKLPVEKLKLKEMSICGNGKDCELEIVTRNPKKTLRIIMRDPRLKVEIRGRIVTQSFYYGDEYLGIQYKPAEDIIISSARMYYPGNDDEYKKDMKEFEEGKLDSIGVTISFVNIALKPGT